MTTPTLDRVQANWWMFLVSGVVSLLFGLALILWPDKTLSIVAWLIGLWILFFGIIAVIAGIFMIMSGLIELWQGFTNDTPERWWWCSPASSLPPAFRIKAARPSP